MQKKSAANRNLQIKKDTLIDFVFGLGPVLILNLFFNIWLSPSELARVIAIPFILLLAKIDDVLDETLRHHSSVHLKKMQTRISILQNRRRNSLFGELEHDKIARYQHEAVPKFIHFSTGSIKILAGMFFFCITVAQIVSLEKLNECNNYIS